MGGRGKLTRALGRRSLLSEWPNGHPLATQHNRTPTLISDDEPEEDPKDDSEEDWEDGMEEDSKSKEETKKKELVTYVTPISVVAPTMFPPPMTHRLGSRMHRIRKIVWKSIPPCMSITKKAPNQLPRPKEKNVQYNPFLDEPIQNNPPLATIKRKERKGTRSDNP